MNSAQVVTHHHCGCRRISKYTICTSSLAEQERQGKFLGLVPRPAAQTLIAQVIAMLDAEAVVVQPKAEKFCKQQQNGCVEKQRGGMMVAGDAHRKVAKIAGPVGGKKHAHQHQSQGQVGNANAPQNAIVAARLCRIRSRATVAGKA